MRELTAAALEQLSIAAAQAGVAPVSDELRLDDVRERLLLKNQSAF